tara:strand:- start:2407 stop:3048 length:642 start_codon:yes stop_codon:yes gene_type:complete
MIKAIIFDFDGVIAESTNIKTDAFVSIYNEYSEEVQARVKDYHVKNSGISRYKKILYYQKEILGQNYSEDAINDLANKFSEIVLQKVIESEYVKGSKEFIERYQLNYDLHIATGTPQEEIEIIIQEKNLQNKFKSIYGTPLSKTEIIRKILTENNYKKENVVFVGDAIADLEGASNNDLNFIGRVPKGETSIFPEKTIIIDDLTSLNDLILNF